MFFLGIFPGFRLDPPFRVHEEPFQVTSKWGVTTPFSRGPHCSTCPYSPKNRLRTHPIESYNDTNNEVEPGHAAKVPEHPGESVTKGSAVDAPRKVPAPATGPAPEEQASTLVEGFKAATASALEASQAAWLGRARSARTQDCDPDPHGCHVGASYPLLSIHTSLPQIPMFLKHPDHLYIPHSELHGEPEHAQMVQEHADRPPTGPPQFLTRQKHKRWFNPLDALKKIFLSERKESKRKGWIVYLTTSFDHADQPATKASIVDPPRDDPTPVAGSAPEQASTLVKGFKVAVTSALEASQMAVPRLHRACERWTGLRTSSNFPVNTPPLMRRCYPTTADAEVLSHHIALITSPQFVQIPIPEPAPNIPSATFLTQPVLGTSSAGNGY
ncbi:hypothetical protein BJV78DRAFT_1157159 [Lactifluus subvellereus]|nr:hypothetical protein BJV78DRAFT_1157159 [Lactifluus subvellereus]